MPRSRIYHASIDYEMIGDEPHESVVYRGVLLKASGGRLVFISNTGDPIFDHAAFCAYTAELRKGVGDGVVILEMSSITHFLQDVPGYKMILGADGGEVMVADPDDDREPITFMASIGAMTNPEKPWYAVASTSEFPEAVNVDV